MKAAVTNHESSPVLLVGRNQLILETDPLAKLHGPGFPQREHVGTLLDEKSILLDRLENSPQAIFQLVERDLHRGGKLAQPVGCGQAGNATTDNGNAVC